MSMDGMDPHEMRMAAGAGAAAILDVLDDDTLALFEPLAEAMFALIDRLREQGLPATSIAQVIVGAAVTASMQDVGMQPEA